MLSDAEMAHLKTLARLELSEGETERLKGDLNDMLRFFEQLRELETEGVEELARPISSTNVFRGDTPRPGMSHAAAMKLAVETEAGFFKVPRTVDAGE